MAQKKFFRSDIYNQGILIEGESSVFPVLTCSDEQLLVLKLYFSFLTKQPILIRRSTELSPSVRFPWQNILRTSSQYWIPCVMHRDRTVHIETAWMRSNAGLTLLHNGFARISFYQYSYYLMLMLA